MSRTPDAGTQIHLPSHTAMAAPGMEPGLVTRPYSEYWSARPATPNMTPVPRKIHPIGFAGRREARRAPSPPKAPTSTRPEAPLYDQRLKPFLTPKARPAAVRARATRASAHASRPAVRSFTGNLPLGAAPILRPSWERRKGAARRRTGASLTRTREGPVAKAAGPFRCGAGSLAAGAGSRTLSEPLTAGPGRGRLDLRHRGGARRVAGTLHLHGDVVISVPALGLPPAGGEQMVEVSRRALPQPLGATLFQVETLVHHFVVIGHCASLPAGVSAPDAQGRNYNPRHAVRCGEHGRVPARGAGEAPGRGLRASL